MDGQPWGDPDHDVAQDLADAVGRPAFGKVPEQPRVATLAVDMDRALLGCTTHLSGVLVTWNRCRNELGAAGLQEVGRALLERSGKRLAAAQEAQNARNVQREQMLRPFIAFAFGVEP